MNRIRATKRKRHYYWKQFEKWSKRHDLAYRKMNYWLSLHNESQSP